MSEPKQTALVASVANLLHPDWPVRSVRTHLDTHHAARPGYQLLVAAVACYGDPATATPARLGENGPWWRAAYVAAGTSEPGTQPPRFLPGIDDAEPLDPDVAQRGAAACRAVLGDTNAAVRHRQQTIAELARRLRLIAPTLTDDERHQLRRHLVPPASEVAS